MKKAIYLLVFGMVIISCTDHEDSVPPNFGKVNTVFEYTSVGQKEKPVKSDTYYTQFGEYITSITPVIFKAKFQTIRFTEDYHELNSIEVINNNLPQFDPKRYADFTNNNTVTMNPEFWGDLQCAYNGDSCYFKNPITLNYFYFRLWYFYQEVQLPQQYADLEGPMIYQFMFSPEDSTEETFNALLVDNYLKARSRCLMEMLYTTTPIPDVFVFGNTDSTFQYYVSETDTIPNEHNLMGDKNTYNIRSHKYVPFTFIPPAKGETKTFTTTMSFDYRNLIQIYAGPDNIPYNQDDVFIYAPNYWERLSVTVN